MVRGTWVAFVRPDPVIPTALVIWVAVVRELARNAGANESGQKA
jgi:hypothetical protein